jgi:hypothetical protein
MTKEINILLVIGQRKVIHAGQNKLILAKGAIALQSKTSFQRNATRSRIVPLKPNVPRTILPNMNISTINMAIQAAEEKDKNDAIENKENETEEKASRSSAVVHEEMVQDLQGNRKLLPYRQLGKREKQRRTRGMQRDQARKREAL